MLQRPFVFGAVLALCVLVSSRTLAGDRALVLTGNDFSLYSVDLGTGTVQTEDSFTGYPGHGSTDHAYYVAAVSGEDVAYLYNAASLAPVATLSTGPGSNPYAAVIDDAGRIFVTCLQTNEVVRFDLTGAETGRVSVGVSPQGILWHNGLLYVANTGFNFSDYTYAPGTVTVLDPATLGMVNTLPVGLNPQALAVEGNRLHVLCTGDYVSAFGEVHVWETPIPAPVDTVPLGGSPGYIAIENGVAHTTDYFGGIYRYHTGTLAVLNDSLNPISLGASGYTSCAGDGMGNLYVTLYDNDVLAKVSAATMTVTDTYLTGDGPQHVTLVTDAPTPVTLLAFTGRRSAEGVTLEWVVSPDLELVELHLERQEPNEPWEILSRVFEEGSHRDTQPVEGAQYRLRASLRNGERTVLGTLDTPAMTALSLRATTNPASGPVRFAATGVTAPGTLELFDAQGRLVSTRPVTGSAFTIQAPAAGAYFARLTQNSRTAVARVVVTP